MTSRTDDEAVFLLPADPAGWLYELGVPSYYATAFGEWVRTGDTAWWSLSTAKQHFDYDPRGHQLLAQYGRAIRVLGRVRPADDRPAAG